jgi:hypothetical protein
MVPGVSRRWVIAGAAVALLGVRFAARAQSATMLTPQHLERIVDAILKTKDTIRVGDGGIVGLSDAGVQTKQIAFRDNGTRYTLAVIVPRQAGGLLFFAYHPKLVEARIHRTDFHLRRTASSRIRGGIGSDWSGGECDADFAVQLAAWAKHKMP